MRLIFFSEIILCASLLNNTSYNIAVDKCVAILQKEITSGLKSNQKKKNFICRMQRLMMPIPYLKKKSENGRIYLLLF